MTKAKKFIALLLTALIFVSVATVAANAETTETEVTTGTEITTEATTGTETTTGSETTTSAPTTSSKDKVEKVDCGADFDISKESTAKINPKVAIKGDPEYTVAYSTSDEKIATVNEKGEVTGVAIGKAVITCTVKDNHGNTVTDTVNVKVSYSFVQWILVAAEACVSYAYFVFDLVLVVFGFAK